MLKSLRNLAILAVAAAGLVAATPAKADPLTDVDLTFASGATFAGIVTFATDDAAGDVTGTGGAVYVEAVSGTLKGYTDTSQTYVGGSATDVIDGLADGGGRIFDSVPDEFSVLLTDADETNSIFFTYNYSNAPDLILAPGDDFGVGVNYSGVGYETADPLVSGSITATPEPSSLLLLASGFVGLAGLLYRKIGQIGLRA
jgi:hypothetical protein